MVFAAAESERAIEPGDTIVWIGKVPAADSKISPRLRIVDNRSRGKGNLQRVDSAVMPVRIRVHRTSQRRLPDSG